MANALSPKLLNRQGHMPGRIWNRLLAGVGRDPKTRAVRSLDHRTKSSHPVTNVLVGQIDAHKAVSMLDHKVGRVISVAGCECFLHDADQPDG